MRCALPILLTALTSILALTGVIPSACAQGSQVAGGLVIDSKAPTQQSREATFWKWFKKVQLPALRKRLSGKPVATEAEAWAGRALDSLADASAPDQAAELLKVSVPLVSGGEGDLLVQYLRCELACTQSIEAAEDVSQLAWLHETVNRAYGEVPPGEPFRFPPSLSFQITLRYFAELSQTGVKPDYAVKQSAAIFLAESLNAGEYPADDGALLAFQTGMSCCSHWMTTRTLELLHTYLKNKSALPRWVQLLFEGRVAIDEAWDARGGGTADTVTEKGWHGFRTHLTKAQQVLAEAHALRPDCPEPAAEMLLVAKGGYIPQNETPRLWLERALAACVDESASLNQYLDILQPKWGGSRGAMLRFAAECAGTGRMETGLGSAVYHILEQVETVSKSTDGREFYQIPEIARLILRVARARATAPALASQRNTQLSYLVSWARVCGDYEAASAALKELKHPMAPRALLWLARMDLDEARLRLELAARATAAGPHLDPLAAQRRKGFPGEAEAGYVKLLEAIPESDADARCYLTLCREMAAFEASVVSGEWTNVPRRKDTLAWIQRAGDWRAGNDCIAAAEGAEGPARLVLAARLPEDYEFELLLERTGDGRCMDPVGLAVKYGFQDSYSDLWYGFSFMRERAKSGTREKKRYNLRGTLEFNDSILPEAKPMFREFRFTGTYKQRLLSLTCNGQTISSIGISGPNPPFNRFAVCCSRLAAGETVKITGLKFRRISGQNGG